MGLFSAVDTEVRRLAVLLSLTGSKSTAASKGATARWCFKAYTFMMFYPHKRTPWRQQTSAANCLQTEWHAVLTMILATPDGTVCDPDLSTGTAATAAAAAAE
jgi:hypothetical protein